MQKGNTNQMIFDIKKACILHEPLYDFISLVIFVVLAHHQSWRKHVTTNFLKPGDKVKLEIDKLGQQLHKVNSYN